MSGTRSAKYVLLLACALIPFLTTHAEAQADHHLRWRTVETAHFRIHYHEPLGLWARTLAADVEAINQRVQRALGLRLQQRVELVIADDNDAANGFAVTLPYNSIRLRAASPDDLSPLADYDDWPTTLLTHEHTHVLQLEQAGGIPRLLQRIFGRFYTPQGSLPGWFIEGLAVVEESAHTTGGRARSTMFDMYLRMDALENRVLDIDWIGFDGEPWPHGNVRYLYGQAFLEFLKREHGERALGQFVEEYGRRLVPYGLNRALKRTIGETFTELYPRFVAELKQRAEQTARDVAKAGRVEGERLTEHGELTRSPRFLSDHEVGYAVSDARHVPELRVLDLRAARGASARGQRIVRTANVGQLAPIPGTRRAVYSATEFHRGVYAYSELSAIDLDGRRRRRLTHGVRAREPDVSPDGQHVAFVTQSAGTSHLELAELADVAGTRRMIVQSRRLEQVYTPRWSPDGKHLAYSAYQRGGYRDIWLVELESGLRTRLTYDRAIDRGPVFSRDGKTLYFSSDRSGIANLYAYSLESGALTQLTNVVSGAFQPDVSPDGKTLVYVGYSSRGFDLHTLSLAQAAARPASAPYERPPARALPEPVALPSTAYQPLHTLWPRYYELSTEDSQAGTRLIVTTSGSDAVGFHSWSLRLGSELSEWDQFVDVAYSYRQARFPVLAYGSLRNHERSDMVVNEGARLYRAREGNVGIGSVFSFPRPLANLSFRLDYLTNFLQKLESIDVPPLDPNYLPPRAAPTGYGARVYWSATYASAQRQPFDISRSWGQLITVAGTLENPYLGSRERDYGVSFRVEQFVRLEWRESVLALAWTGAHHTPVALGGYSSQLAPLRDALVGVRAAPGDYARLRGYPVRYGDSLQVLQVEYRVLLSRINRGVQTLPIFARRVHAALFVDAGNAWYGDFVAQHVGVGIGGELRLDWSSHYGNDYMLRAGVAHGLTEAGELQWYTTVATPF